MDEASLIARARAGDLRAFNELVSKYQGMVYNLAFRILGQAEAASDAAQEAFLSAYQSLSQYRGGSYKGWLLRIVTNACYDELRRQKRRPAYSLEEAIEDTPIDFPSPEEEGPEEHTLRRELEETIQEGISSLPPDQRITLILADVQGLSYEEVAEATLANLGTVKSRLSRARATLRDYLLTQGELLPEKYRLKAEGDQEQR